MNDKHVSRHLHTVHITSSGSSSGTLQVRNKPSVKIASKSGRRDIGTHPPGPSDRTASPNRASAYANSKSSGCPTARAKLLPGCPRFHSDRGRCHHPAAAKHQECVALPHRSADAHTTSVSGYCRIMRDVRALTRRFVHEIPKLNLSTTRTDRSDS